MLAQKTKWSIWFALIVSFFLLMAGTFLLPSLLATAGAALLITALASYLVLRLRKHDAHIQLLSRLTPIVDWSRFAGEVAILEASRDALAATLSNRSEEHTSELQSLMRISYAVFCLKKKKRITKK